MDPVEAGTWLGGRPQQLVLLTGLDPTNKHTHGVLANAFGKRSSDRPPLKLCVVNNVDIPAKEGAKSIGKGILRKEWPNKYLDKMPALVVVMMDLDWDDQNWAEKKVEAQSKCDSLRAQLRPGCRLAVVLLQERSLPASGDDPLATERATELCNQCQLTAKQLFVLPVNGDVPGYVCKLEEAFHELAQGFYQHKLKAIRARAVPGNTPALVVRQLFKLAFLSEMRQDTHTALRNYKLAYEQCRDSREHWDPLDLFEWRSVAGLLNYKMCELCFLHSTALEAISQMRRHQAAFFSLQPGVYPSPQLAAVEAALWKSKQCWHFAELFEKAVLAGLSAVATLNPGTHLDGAAAHYAQANTLIQQLKAGLPQGLVYPMPDPLIGEPVFFGQRPWRVGYDSLAPAAKEAEAVLAMQLRLRVNHDGVLSLLSAAMNQYKKYGCGRMQRKVMNEMAEQYASSGDVAKALHVWQLVARDGVPPAVRARLLASALWASYSHALAREFVWAAVQLLSVSEAGQPAETALLAEAVACVLAGQVPVSPYQGQPMCEQVAVAWQRVLSEPQFVAVSASGLDVLVRARAMFLAEPTGVSLEAKLPVRVSLTLHSPHPLSVSGVRVCVDVAGRRKTADQPHLIETTTHRRLDLKPYETVHVYVWCELATISEHLQEGHALIVSLLSVELGDPSGVHACLEWDAPALSASARASHGPGVQSLRLGCPSAGVVAESGVSTECLQAEVASVSVRLVNRGHRTVSDVRLAFSRSEQADSAAAVLFVDPSNELRGELSINVASRIEPNHTVDVPIRFSAQLVGNIELILETSYDVIGGGAGRRYGRVPLSIESRQPFSLGTTLLTSNGVPVQSLLNHSRHVIRADVEAHAAITVTSIDWLLADLLKPVEGGIHEEGKELHDELGAGDVISYCSVVCARRADTDDSDAPLGRVALTWKRCGNDGVPVRSLVPLCAVKVLSCPVEIGGVVGVCRVEMRECVPIRISLTSHHSEALHLTLTFEASDVWMFAGDRRSTLRLLPGESGSVSVVVMALQAGRLPFPRVSLRSPQLPDPLLTEALRALPATIFVLPLSKQLASSTA